MMRGSIFQTGLLMLPVFAFADKGDYPVSLVCTITVKFNTSLFISVQLLSRLVAGFSKRDFMQPC